PGSAQTVSVADRASPAAPMAWTRVPTASASTSTGLALHRFQRAGSCTATRPRPGTSTSTTACPSYAQGAVSMETTVPSIEALPAATGASPCVVAQAATTISNASGNTAGRRPEARCMGMSCYLVMLSPRLTGQPPREIVEVHAAGRTAPDSRRTSFQLLQQDPPAFDRPVRD